MKRIRIPALCLSLLATLSVVGCVCPPAGYYAGSRVASCAPCDTIYSSPCTPAGCDPCGPVEACGAVEYCGNPCGPQACGPSVYASRSFMPKTVDYRSSFSNLGNGVLLFGRGLLDLTAAPFVIAGNLLSSGCRYQVLTFCDNEIPVGNCYQSANPCSSPCSTGCDTCAGGYTEGIQYNAPVRTTTFLAPPRHNSVVQASYQEPTAPVRFSQPR